MEIEKICVLGAGAMGHGIAQVCAQAGYQVNLEDIKDEFVQKGIDRIRKFLDGSVELKRVAREEANATLGRITGTTDLKEAAEDANLVIEAIAEDKEIKKEMFRQLDQLCPSHTIFASNTSFQCITEMAMETKRPEKFLGMHWFNPPQIMRGIEVIKAEKTSPEVVNTVADLCKKLGKEPIICKDSIGFIANRIVLAWRTECFSIYDEGIASFRDIDKAFKEGYNFRMGPFEFTGLTGLDFAVHTTELIYQETRNDIFKPPQCLIRKARAGDFGRKTGRGFYEYK